MTIQTRRGEGVRVLRIEDELHNVVGMALEDADACSLLVPIPSLDRHIVVKREDSVMRWVHYTP